MAPVSGQTSKRAAERVPETAELVSALSEMSLTLHSWLIAQARASGLGLLEFAILTRAAATEGVTARDAGRQLALNTSTMTGLADRLEEGKLVRRHRHPTDRRLVVLKATPRGRRMVQRTLAPLASEFAGFAATLQEDRHLYTGFSRRLTDRLVRVPAPAGSRLPGQPANPG